jgi:ABC-type polysaccharide/polyol phosphate transport system ATPase subunit
VVGSNGAGKTTLLRILAGVTLPTQGYVRIEGRVSSLIALGAGFHGELTGRENVFLYCALMGLAPRNIRQRVQDIVAFAEIGDYIDVAYKRYSTGMMARLGFAAAIHVDPGLVLVDEVLAVGDQSFVGKSMTALRRLMAESTVVFVSHDLEAVRALCGRAIWLDRGAIRADGPTASVVDAYVAHGRAVGS